VKHRALFITSCMSLATCAVSFAVRGDVAGAMGTAFHLTNEQVGFVLSPAFYGFALAILIGGLVIDAVGMRILHALSGVAFMLGVGLIVLAPRPSDECLGIDAAAEESPLAPPGAPATLPGSSGCPSRT